MVFAIVGTVISAVFIGGGVYLLGQVSVLFVFTFQILIQFQKIILKFFYLNCHLIMIIKIILLFNFSRMKNIFNERNPANIFSDIFFKKVHNLLEKKCFYEFVLKQKVSVYQNIIVVKNENFRSYFMFLFLQLFVLTQKITLVQIILTIYIYI